MASDPVQQRARRPGIGLRRVVSMLAMSIFVAHSAAAQGVVDAPMTPLQLSIAAGYSQLFKDEVPVYGLRTSMLWGEQSEITGLDIGLFHTAVKTNGVAIGIYNGLSGSGTGAQLGLGTYVQEHFAGVQAGMANAIIGELHGAQIGMANSSGAGAGFQLGLLNITESMKGIQIGLWNVNPNGFLPYFPIINFSFQDSDDSVDE